MLSQKQKTIVCVAGSFRGTEFIEEAKARGCKVYVLTIESLADAAWPVESLDQILFVEDNPRGLTVGSAIRALTPLAQKTEIDRLVAFDDVDLEKAAALREHFRISGMGDATARYFKDKLAMRLRASEVGIWGPEFVHVLNLQSLKNFVARVPFPYILKPRFNAPEQYSKIIQSEAELWENIAALGENQSFYFIERLLTGTPYQVDSIMYNREIDFSAVYAGLQPVNSTITGQQISRFRTIQKASADEQLLLSLNRKVLLAFGMALGITHAEFIKDTEGRFIFLGSTASINSLASVKLIEAASGINLWREWAKIEILGGVGKYILPEHASFHAGALFEGPTALGAEQPATQDVPAVSRFTHADQAVTVIRDISYDKVSSLLESYAAPALADYFPRQEVVSEA